MKFIPSTSCRIYLPSYPSIQKFTATPRLFQLCAFQLQRKNPNRYWFCSHEKYIFCIRIRFEPPFCIPLHLVISSSPFLHLSCTLLTAGDRYIFLPYIYRYFFLQIDVMLHLSGSIRMSVYAGNINTSACLSLSIQFYTALFLFFFSPPLSVSWYTSCPASPLWHSKVYFPTVGLPIFPYSFLILLLFVLVSLTGSKLPKISRNEIAFPHMGLKEYIL